MDLLRRADWDKPSPYGARFFHRKGMANLKSIDFVLTVHSIFSILGNDRIVKL